MTNCLLAIRKGEPINDGVWMTSQHVDGNLGTYGGLHGQVITWEQALNSQQDLMPPRLDWNVSLNEPEVAMPGVTKFV